MTAAALDARTIALLDPSLFRYALKKTGRDDLARELVQDTWVAAIASLGKFEGRSSLRTWLTSILRRKLVDFHRRSRPHVDLDAVPELSAPQLERESMDDHAATQLLLETLATLPPKERRAVTLCDVEGKERDDAAALLGVRRETLRVLLHRGRKRLREALEASGYTNAALT
jgi:RNA polymerase sigma-70 factor (ECF subfamily)